MIHRRHAIGLLAAAAVIPSRVLADTAPESEVRKSLLKHFTDEGTAGTFAAFKTDDKKLIVSDGTRTRSAILPASTFKIPNSIIALDTGVVADPDKDVFKWDGVTRSIPEWNKDHTLRTAIAVSAVPVYQEIARRIGAERMQKYVDAFDYGNRNIGGGIDRFWLTGDLRINPMQQIAFVDKLRRGVLPALKRAQELTRDILTVTKAGDSIIRAKTGLIGVDDRTAIDGVKASLGWLVGWAEKGGAQTVFALNLDIREPKHTASRMTIAQQCLRDIGAI
ncbi:penicillin-binding transpeptidase domain-containing protein [Bradyrhizobium sp. G127]|uniref:penicillin-binding transpeptidase domain-containing protein n=1 Tax=Bradyrhizobium sp. G127 TaxID=2904800 RepID=UPI001F1D7B20|nr:class D beta-lactamase [Bradyrhizobium sp. G127]